MPDTPTLEYRPANPRPEIHPAWAFCSLALAALPFIGRYAWPTLEAFHPFDVPPWNISLGNAATCCLAVGIVAMPITIILAVIGLIRFRDRRFLQAISLIALLADVWVLGCFFYLLFVHDLK